MPHAPIKGFTLLCVMKAINLPNNSPATVSITNANNPSSKICKVEIFKKLCAVMVDPIARPRNRVAILMISFCAALLRRSTTRLSLSRLPNIKAAIKGAASGATKLTRTVTNIGNITKVRRDTGFGAYSILIIRSFRVVINFIIGGWIMGIRLMYEYAATAIGAKISGANLLPTKIAVGPSIAPITPIEAAWFIGNPSSRASNKVA